MSLKVVVTGNEKNELDYVAYQVARIHLHLFFDMGFLRYLNKAWIWSELKEFWNIPQSQIFVV